jgi:hypothetical protein
LNRLEVALPPFREFFERVAKGLELILLRIDFFANPFKTSNGKGSDPFQKNNFRGSHARQTRHGEILAPDFQSVSFLASLGMMRKNAHIVSGRSSLIARFVWEV